MPCTEYSTNSHLVKQDKVIDHWDCDSSQLAPVKGETSFSSDQNVAPILVVGKLKPQPWEAWKNNGFSQVATMLEGIACSDIFQFLRHLWRCAVQFLRDTLLLMWVHGVELLTKVSIDHILEAYKQSKWERWPTNVVSYPNLTSLQSDRHHFKDATQNMRRWLN